MLTKRIIPCLDIKNGRTVKGVNFLDLRDAGDPVELADIYAKTGADELVFLDISATEERRRTLADLVKRVAEKINIPFTVGGGIGSVADVEVLLQNGADKVSINSSAVKNPQLINDLAQKFGSQCVVVAIDAKKINGKDYLYLAKAKLATSMDDKGIISNQAKFSEAVSDLTKAAELNPNLNTEFTEIGIKLYSGKAYLEAAKLFELAVKNLPTKPFAELPSISLTRDASLKFPFVLNNSNPEFRFLPLK